MPGQLKIGNRMVEITDELQQFVDSLPPGGAYRGGKKWTAKEDEKLLAAWPQCKHTAVAAALGMSQATALKRYRELTEKIDGQS